MQQCIRHVACCVSSGCPAYASGGKQEGVALGSIREYGPLLLLTHATLCPCTEDQFVGLWASEQWHRRVPRQCGLHHQLCERMYA